MTPGEEFELCLHDRPAWRQYVAPRMAGVLTDLSDDKLGEVWGRMQRAYQRTTWRHLDAATRERIRRLRNHQGEPA